MKAKQVRNMKCSDLKNINKQTNNNNNKTDGWLIRAQAARVQGPNCYSIDYCHFYFGRHIFEVIELQETNESWHTSGLTKLISLMGVAKWLNGTLKSLKQKPASVYLNSPKTLMMLSNKACEFSTTIIGLMMHDSP